MHLSCFGRSFLTCTSIKNASQRRVAAAIAAAAKRHPNGYIQKWRDRSSGKSNTITQFMVNGYCLPLIQTNPSYR